MRKLMFMALLPLYCISMSAQGTAPVRCDSTGVHAVNKVDSIPVLNRSVVISDKRPSKSPVSFPQTYKFKPARRIDKQTVEGYAQIIRNIVNR